MTQQYKVGQMVKTEGGYDAKILLTDAPGKYPILALVTGGPEFPRGMIKRYSSDGKASSDDWLNLILPEPKLTGFINVHEGGSSCTFLTRKCADKWALSNRTHCIDLSDFTEEQLRKWRVED